MLPKQARGTSRKHVTKPFTQPAAPDSSFSGIDCMLTEAGFECSWRKIFQSSQDIRPDAPVSQNDENTWTPGAMLTHYFYDLMYLRPNDTLKKNIASYHDYIKPCP